MSFSPAATAACDTPSSLASFSRPSSCPAAEFLHWIRISVRRNCHKVALVAYINPPGALPCHTPVVELDLGSARLAKGNCKLSNGVESGLFQGAIATNPCITAAEVMLKDGHKGTRQRSTIACRPNLSELEPSRWARRKFQAPWIAPQARQRR